MPILGGMKMQEIEQNVEATHDKVILLLLLYTAVTSLTATFTLQRCFSHNNMMQATATRPFIDDIQVGKFEAFKVLVRLFMCAAFYSFLVSR